MEEAALSLAQVASWVGEEPNLAVLIDTLIQEKTQSMLAEVKECSKQVTGGAFEHRGQLMILPSGAFVNYDQNIMSHIIITSDTATDFARKQGDYTIIFQAMKVAVGSLIIHKCLAGLPVVVSGDAYSVVNLAQNQFMRESLVRPMLPYIVALNLAWRERSPSRLSLTGKVLETHTRHPLLWSGKEWNESSKLTQLTGEI